MRKSKLSSLFLTYLCLLAEETGLQDLTRTDSELKKGGGYRQVLPRDCKSFLTAPSVCSPLSAVLNKSDIYSDPKISQTISSPLLMQRLEFSTITFHVGFMVSKAKLKELSTSVVTIS